MIMEGEAGILQETTLHAFRNQEKTKQRSTIAISINTHITYDYKKHERKAMKMKFIDRLTASSR